MTKHLTIESYIPAAANKKLQTLLAEHPIEVKVVKKRKSKHGDFRWMPSGTVQITINEQANPYRFLITLLHEIAHHLAFKFHGPRIQPHGKEWKQTFRALSAPFLIASIFPQSILSAFAQHLKHPKASSDSDFNLGLALREYDPFNHKKIIFDLPFGAMFQLDNGRVFWKGQQRRKRFECREKGTLKIYLFQPNAEVHYLKEK